MAKEHSAQSKVVDSTQGTQRGFDGFFSKKGQLTSTCSIKELGNTFNLQFSLDF